MIEGKQQVVASYYGAYLKRWLVKDGNYYLNIKQYPYNFYIKIIPENSTLLLDNMTNKPNLLDILNDHYL